MFKPLLLLPLLVSLQLLVQNVGAEPAAAPKPSGGAFLELEPDRKRRDDKAVAEPKPSGGAFLELEPDRKRRDDKAVAPAESKPSEGGKGFLALDRKRRDAEDGCLCSIVSDVQKFMMSISVAAMVQKYKANPSLGDMLSMKMKLMLPEPVRTFMGQIHESDLKGLKSVIDDLLTNKITKCEELHDALKKKCPGILAALQWAGLKLKVNFQIFLSMLGSTAKKAVKKIIDALDITHDLQDILNNLKKPEPPVVSSIMAALQSVVQGTDASKSSGQSVAFVGIAIDIKVKIQADGAAVTAMASIQTNIKMCGCVLDRLPKENIKKMPEQFKMFIAQIKDSDIKGFNEIIVDIKVDKIKTVKELHMVMQDKCPGVLDALKWLIVRMRTKFNNIWNKLSPKCQDYLIDLYGQFKHAIFSTFWGMLGDDAQKFFKDIKEEAKKESLDLVKQVKEKTNMSILESIGSALKETFPPLSPYMHSEMKVYVGMN